MAFQSYCQGWRPWFCCNQKSRFSDTTTKKLLKLYLATPDPVVFFLGGSLPAQALLHMSQLTLFIMITQLPENILNRFARHILTTAPDSSQSWFIMIRNICFQYFLPHPLLFLQYPPKMDSFKETAKLKIKDFWRKKLTEEALCFLLLDTSSPSLCP